VLVRHLTICIWSSWLICNRCLQGTDTGWYDGAGIGFAICLVVLVTGRGSHVWSQLSIVTDMVTEIVLNPRGNSFEVFAGCP
jgi:hypothetical protein